eukprot:COSAG01_NODE_45315_length_410_cov_1.167203_2_plen_93_part_01
MLLLSSPELSEAASAEAVTVAASVVGHRGLLGSSAGVPSARRLQGGGLHSWPRSACSVRSGGGVAAAGAAAAAASSELTTAEALEAVDDDAGS